MMYWETILSLLLLGLAGILFQAKSLFNLLKVVQLFFFSAILLFLVKFFNPEDQSYVFALLGIASLNFILGSVSVLKKPFLRIVIPTISIIGILFWVKGDVVVFLEEGNNFGNQFKFIITGAVLALIGYDLGVFKIKLLDKIIGGFDSENLPKALMLFFAGSAYFLGGFGGGELGLLIISTALISTGFYRDEEDQLSVPITITALFPVLLSLADLPTASLLTSDVIQGILFGLFGVYVSQQFWISKNRNFISVGVGYLLTVLFAVGIIFAGTQNEKMGGADAFLGMLLGAGVFIAVRGKGFVGVSLLSLIIPISIYILPMTINQEVADINADMIVIGDESSSDQKWLTLDNLKGEHSINSKTSKVTFILKPKEGKGAEGAFKVVQGNISISDNIEESTFDITLPMSSFTTFNTYRDESLVSKDYFNVPKFPEMKYNTSSLKKVGEFDYELIGEFTMLGVSKELKVKLKRPDIDGGKILIGTGTIDRTMFGMQPSESEGNLVDFNFQVELAN